MLSIQGTSQIAFHVCSHSVFLFLVVDLGGALCTVVFTSTPYFLLQFMNTIIVLRRILYTKHSHLHLKFKCRNGSSSSNVFSTIHVI
ncbi:hypothetical protein EDC01DRAFT_672434 [Geopyxis carbonaria]|nr:hypothetical protein EDC01DRAFT_672434 [Geopyxis carbonaria]